jgi:L-lactate dehydrogenase complex protein LldG
MGSDARLAAMPWRETALDLSSGRSRGLDLSGISHAEAGIAETGTLALVSGPENPTTLNFLPDNHIVVLRAADIAGDLEAIWTKLRKRYGKGAMPRTVNFITGPSRSGDIEQTILLGAHGPRALHIVIVED